MNKPSFFFDGECSLCNRAVRFLSTVDSIQRRALWFCCSTPTSPIQKIFGGVFNAPTFLNNEEVGLGCKTFLGAFVFPLFVSAQQDFESFSKDRAAAIKKFEDYENRLRRDRAHQVAPATPEYESSTKLKYHFNFESPTLEEEEAKEAPNFEENAHSGTSYFHQLTRAFGCFKGFLASMFKAKEARDQKLIACNVQGSETCLETTSASGAKEFQSLSDEFYACLEQKG